MVTKKSTQKHMYKLLINSFLKGKPKVETFINHVDSNEILWHSATCHKGLCRGTWWLSGRVFDGGGGFEPHQRCCVVHG